MKRIFLLAMVFAVACNSANNKNTSADSSSGASTETTSGTDDESNSTITFKANGETVNTGVLTISGFQFANQPKGLNITSDMHQDKRAININLHQYGPGDYTFTQESVNTPHTIGLYFPDYSQANDSYTFTSGHVNVSGFDTVKNVLNATFSGTVKNEQGKTIEITDGVIKNGKISPMQEMPK